MRIHEDMEQRLLTRLEQLHTLGGGTIGDMLQLRLTGCDVAKGEFRMVCATGKWMRNIAGTLHGGMCATVVDQAMGFVAHCCKKDAGTAPTVQLSVDYHRPLVPGEDVLVKVKIISVSRNLMRFTAEAYRAAEPDKLCLTGSSIFFNKPAKKG